MAKSEISFDKKLDKNLGKRINQINKYKEFLKNQGSSVDKSYSEINEYLEKKLEQTYYFKQNNKTDSSIPKDNSDIKNAVKEYMGRTYIDKAPQNGELDKSFIKDLNKIYGKNYFKDNVLKEKESRQKYRDENNGKNRPIDIDGISEKINIPQAISSEKTNISSRDILSHNEEKLLKDVDKQFGTLMRASHNERAIKQARVSSRNEMPADIENKRISSFSIKDNTVNFGTLPRKQSTNQNEAQTSQQNQTSQQSQPNQTRQTNNAEDSTSRANRNSGNSFFSDTQSISQRASITSDTFGGNNRNSTYTDISNGSSSQTNNRELQKVNSVDSKVSQQSSRRSSTLGG